MSGGGKTATPAAAPAVVEPAAEVKTEAAPTRERWVSTIAAEHTVIVRLPKGPMGIQFKDYGVELDLTNPEHQEISKGLRASSREGRDIFRVGNAYPGHGLGGQTQLMQKLRTLAATGIRGIRTIQAIFSDRELREAGINPSNPNVDEMIVLALRTKTIEGLK